MPCACQIPVPNYPENAEWGPILWSILHGLAEKSGRAAMPSDETREWIKFLKHTGDVLPCEKCRDHFRRYNQKYPITIFMTMPYSQFKEAIKTWLWRLHNEINTENGKPTFDYADLEKTYSNVNLQDLFWRLDPVMKKAIQLNGISLMKWTCWVHSFKMLRSILAV